jgi:hypothetical protein
MITSKKEIVAFSVAYKVIKVELCSENNTMKNGKRHVL